MREYYWMDDTGAVVSDDGGYVKTYDKWADLWFTDCSNEYGNRIRGLEPDSPCKKISREEADRFAQANKLR